MSLKFKGFVLRGQPTMDKKWQGKQKVKSGPWHR
jgi:hypothetical protein